MTFYDKFEYKYFAGEYLVTPTSDEGKRLVENGVRSIPDNITKLVFRSSAYVYDKYTHKVPLMIENISIIPDSVTYLTIIPKFGPILTMPKNINSVFFHDCNSIIENIPNMFMWPGDARYLYYICGVYRNISNLVKCVKCIHDILPQPIYEEILDNMEFTDYL